MQCGRSYVYIFAFACEDGTTICISNVMISDWYQYMGLSPDEES